MPVRVAEQVLADVQRRLSALETELDAIMREVEEAERQAEAANTENERLLTLAEDLLGSAQRLRAKQSSATRESSATRPRISGKLAPRPQTATRFGAPMRATRALMPPTSD